MYKIEDSYYPKEIFNNILKKVKQYPLNLVPEFYNGKRVAYGKARQYLTERSDLSDLVLTNLPFKKSLKRIIEVANDVNGFWLSSHSDHPAKREVTVIYLEGDKNNGTTFHFEDYEETVDFIPNRAVHFTPDKNETFDPMSKKHSVKPFEISDVRRTIIVNYVDSTWNNLEVCYDR